MKYSMKVTGFIPEYAVDVHFDATYVKEGVMTILRFKAHTEDGELYSAEIEGMPIRVIPFIETMEPGGAGADGGANIYKRREL